MVFESAIQICVTSFIAIFLTAIFFVDYLSKYWKRKNVYQLTPSFPFGNFSSIFRQQASIGEECTKIYKENKTMPFVGVYLSFRPSLIVNDPELIKNIMIRDFQHFHDRGAYVDEKRDPLSGHLFSLNGEKWKSLRAKLTPTFTTGKLRGMFQTLLETGLILQKHVDNIATNNKTVEIRDILARYSTDIIASIAFGHQIDSINNPNAPFRVIGRKVFATNFRNGLRVILNFLLPKLNLWLHFKSVDDDVEDFMISMVKETMDHREKNNVSRRDFMQLLLQLRNLGRIELDEEWDIEKLQENERRTKTLSLNELAAQAHIFFLAGFETSSTTMSFCLYELAKNAMIQQKVQAEIDQILQKHQSDGLTYNSIMEMQYLEQCIDETLRKYPPVPILNRECTTDYQIPGTNIIIEKGTSIILPIMGLQHDPKFYPDPQEFKPERFDAETKSLRKN